MAEQGIKSDYLRMRAIPFTQQVDEFIQNQERIYVVEMNRDGQLKQLLTIAYPHQAHKFISIAHLDGMPLTARFIRYMILSKEEE
jgi:2-oxoglutarate ferredoxin oxidoreductase subunit alpha